MSQIISGVVLVTLISLWYVVGTEYYNNGPIFTFPQPSIITVIKGQVIPGHTIQFPKIFPFNFYRTLPALHRFEVGNVLTIELNEEVKRWNSKRLNQLRIDNQFFNLGNARISSTFFFNMDGIIDLTGKNEVTLRITGLKEAEAHHQKDDNGKGWFWLREFYRAEII